LHDWDHPIFYEYEELRCIRTTAAKLILRHGTDIHELYDLKADPGETTNLFGQPDVSSLQSELTKLLTDHFEETTNPEFDLWKGGRSKAQLLK